jgi:cyanate permease
MFQSKKEVSNARVSAPVKASVAAGLMAVAGYASADLATVITGAFSSAQTNFGLAATGLITAVAVLTGIGLIVSLLRK